MAADTYEKGSPRVQQAVDAGRPGEEAAPRGHDFSAKSCARVVGCLRRPGCASRRGRRTGLHPGCITHHLRHRRVVRSASRHGSRITSDAGLLAYWRVLG